MTDQQVEAIVSRLESAMRGSAPTSHGPTVSTTGAQGGNAAALADYQRLLGEKAQNDALINQTPPRLRELTEMVCPGCSEALWLEPGYYREDDELGISYWTVKHVINHAERCPVLLAELAQQAADGL
jgi:hypothetical protein